MFKFKKKDNIINYLGKERFNTLIKYKEIVEASHSDLDDKMYHDMLLLIYKYSTFDVNDFASYKILRESIRNYYDVSIHLLSKINKDDNDNAYQVYKFINEYTKINMNYKLYMIEEFKQNNEIYEEKKEPQFMLNNSYTKLLQILSVKYKNGYKKESEEVYNNSNLKTIQEKAKKITGLINKINKKVLLIEQKKFVKPTVNVLDIMCTLPDTIVNNEEEFQKLVNSLYELLWENEARTYATNHELDFISDIRRYYYHDLEHGKEKDYKKKYELVHQFYLDAISKDIPSSAKEWQKVQEYMYDLIISFLEKIDS